MSMTFKVFDYIVAPDGSIYVIRAVTKEWVVAHLVYQKIGHENYTRSKAVFFEDVCLDNTFALGDWGDKIFPMDSVKPLRKRESAIPISHILNKIGLSSLDESPFSISWFGSRSIGLNQGKADYDFILEGFKNPRKWLEEHVVSHHKHIRFFNRAEHEVRIDNYLANNSFISREKLLDLLDISSIYLWVDEFEVGLFYRNPHETGEVYSNYGFTNSYELETIEGVIRGCNGLSFSMPRKFLLDTDRGDV